MTEEKAVRSAADALMQQREDHGVIMPINKANQLATNGASPVAGYLAECGVGMNGTFFKFAKDGKVRKTSDEEEIPEGTEFVVAYDQIQAGWIKFNGKGNPPDRHMGPIFDGYQPPNRESLGDTDQSQWETDLSGKPSDPWRHQMLVPLQHSETGELFVFGTTSLTGRREVGNLIRHCDRLRNKEPDAYPVIKLQVGGFAHRDKRVGWVKTPKFAVVGRAPKNNMGAASSAIADDMSDAIPF
jgi:hypothetical protein